MNTYKSEEADAISTRSAAAKEAGDCEEDSNGGEYDGNLVDDNDGSSRIITKQSPEEEWIAVDVNPYCEDNQSPATNLHSFRHN